MRARQLPARLPTMTTGHARISCIAAMCWRCCWIVPGFLCIRPLRAHSSPFLSTRLAMRLVSVRRHRLGESIVYSGDAFDDAAAAAAGDRQPGVHRMRTHRCIA